MDYARLPLFVLFFFVVGVLVSGGWIAYTNRGSETIVLGYSALVAAVSVFGIQLLFQMRSSLIEEAIPTQVLVDTTAASPRVLPFHGSDVMRVAYDEQAGKWLAKENGGAFKEDSRL